MGHADPTGCGISHSTPLVQQTRSSSRSPPASSGTQPVLLHRRISNRMGSQLAESSSLRTVVSPRFLSAHQLAGARGHPIGCTSVGTSVAQSDCSGVLWQQYSSSLHSQTGRDPFHISVQQNSETISSSGLVFSHSNPSSWSQECDSRCNVSNQQPQSHRMEDSSGNLTQSVLCLRDPPIGHVRHGGEQGDSSLCFTLPGWQGLGGRCPIHILGRLRPSVRLPSSSHNAQNPPQDQGTPTTQRWFTLLISTRLDRGTRCYYSSAFVLPYRWPTWHCSTTFPTFTALSSTESPACWM